MDRTKFFKEVVVNNVKEVDFLYNPLSSFEMRHDPSYYRTSLGDVGRPDLISYKNYGTVRYWWIICLVNQLENPLTDIEMGVILKIPSVLDIYDFYRRYKIRA